MRASKMDTDPGPRSRLGRIARVLGICALPIVSAVLLAGPANSRKWGVWRTDTVDLAVYLRAGRALLEGGDVYNLPDSLPFLYPPFAAILAVPLSLLPFALVQIGWAALLAGTLLAVFHRFGLRGWPLSLVTAAAIPIVEPIDQTLRFGQLGVFLVGLVVLDLVGEPRILRRSGKARLLPQGVLVGLATAIKLTPGLFIVYLLLIRKFRAAVVASATMIIASLLALVIAPSTSISYWLGLARGDTGLGGSIIYLFNQSILGATTRILGYTGLGNAVGLALAAAAAIFGVIVAAQWYRQGESAMAVTLCGVATLLASPVSWSHHFVWVAPLGLLLVLQRHWPARYRTMLWCFVVWVVIAPFRALPNGDDLEQEYSWWQNLVAATTPILGMLTLVLSAVVVRRLPDPLKSPAPKP